MRNNNNFLGKKYSNTITKLHDHMVACRKYISIDSQEVDVEFCPNYIGVQEEYGPIASSGLTTIFYSRYFDGIACTRDMTVQDSATLFETSLLMQLLTTPRNRGQYPEALSRVLGVSPQAFGAPQTPCGF